MRLIKWRYVFLIVCAISPRLPSLLLPSQKRTLELPVNSSFVINTISKKEAEQQEKNQLKKLVLEYDERERYGIVPNELSLGGGSQTAAATGSSSGRTGVSSFSSSSSIRQPRSKKVLWSNISSSASLRRK